MNKDKELFKALKTLKEIYDSQSSNIREIIDIIKIVDSRLSTLEHNFNMHEKHLHGKK